MSRPSVNEIEVDELREQLARVAEAADGDSNDTEIRRLRDALSMALVRWPELQEVEW
jgi:uncharacterized membrane protein